MKNSLTIVSVSAEVAPYSKAGGVADVTRALPRALHKLGYNVLLVTPLHGCVDVAKWKLDRVAENVPIQIDDTSMRMADFWRGEVEPGLSIYFIDNHKYFSSHKRIYGTSYQNTRYLFFNLAVFKLLNILKISPNILHCHDWQTGLIPHFLNTRFRDNPMFSNTRTVYTIHNLTFQFGADWWTVPGEKRDDGRSALPSFEIKQKIERINFAKRAILNADIINTVSETYAGEILQEDLGQDLHRILQKRADRLYGIVNGLDYNDFNPATDPGLFRNYDFDTLNVKTKNKLFLQRELGLAEDQRIPVIGMIGRITEQKGYDLVREILDPLLRLDIQLVVLGGGDKTYINFLRTAMRKHPKKVAGHLEFDANIATRFYAGTDLFLMPSRFEPCGITQLISLRYGSVPIVRATGGLVDTVTDFNPKTDKGNGFMFKTYDSRDMLVAIARAVETYRQPELWNRLVRRSMKQSFSWEIPARKYVTLYRKAMVVDHQQQ